MRVGVTGASGYIGRELQAVLPPGWSVVALGRRGTPPGQAWRACDLREPPPEGLLDGLDAVVHLAADTGAGDVAPGQEIAFALSLARAARERGIPLVFVSSQAASPDAPTPYGRTKAAIEAAVLPIGAVAIRPGLVYGGAEAGLFGALCALLRRLPFRPRLGPAPPVQPIHVRDLYRAILDEAAMRGLDGRVLCVADEPVAFDAVLAAIARDRLRCLRVPVPVPVGLLRFALRVAEPVMGPRMGPGRLDSLLRLPAMDTARDLALLGIAPRALSEGMSRTGGPRRGLLREGHALARAMLGSVATRPGILRRYVRALAAHSHRHALLLHPALLAFPALLASLDRAPARRDMAGGDLAWRMEAMCRLCEADPALAPTFLGAVEQGRSAALAGFARAAVAEAAARGLHPVARRLGGSR